MGRRAKLIPFPNDPSKSASLAGLRYMRAEGPGIQRRGSGKNFRYLQPDGKPLQDPDTLARIRSLVIPPAWTDVWICPNPNGHLQAVGRDVRGRKQYRYHPSYRHVRDQTKFGRMLEFGKALPRIRAQVEKDLAGSGLPREKVLAAVVKLLDSTGMRIGNDEYAKQNDSYGLTTLQDTHVKIDGTRMRFRFRGKSGQNQDIEFTDRRLARIVKQCRDIPGYELFQYLDSEGQPVDVTSADVNEYIRQISGEEFTAKDFRTWNGTGAAAVCFEQKGPAGTQAETKRNIVQVVKDVAARLGNRPATCKKYYVHPAVISAYEDGSLFEIFSVCKESCQGSLRREEQCVMHLLDVYTAKSKAPVRAGGGVAKPVKASLRKGA